MPTVFRPTVEQTLDALWSKPKTLWGLSSTVDHKTVGKRYIVTAMISLLPGGVETILMCMQPARSELRLLQPEAYDQIFSMHSVTMIRPFSGPELRALTAYLQSLK